VQQAVDAAEVNERTVIGEVLDRAAYDRAFLQVVHKRRALGRELLFHDGATRDDDVVALLVELDDLELERLVLKVGSVANRPHIDERTGEERADVFDLDSETTLDATGDDADDDLGFGERIFESGPGAGALGLLARQAGFAGAVLDGVEGHFNHVAGLDFDLAALVLELLDWDDRFGLQANVDDDHVIADIHHETRENLPGANPLARQALLEQLRKTFSHVVTHAVPFAPHE